MDDRGRHRLATIVAPRARPPIDVSTPGSDGARRQLTDTTGSARREVAFPWNPRGSDAVPERRRGLAGEPGRHPNATEARSGSA